MLNFATKMMDESYVSEIFGFPPTNKDKIVESIRKNHICPFQENHIECDPINKKSNLMDDHGKLLLEHQTGACSVFHTFRSQETKPIIICPYRFLEKNDKSEIKVFQYIQNKFFSEKEVIFVPEIGLGKYGRADWMICELDMNSGEIEIVDFTHLEFQSDATTNTRELVLCVRDFFNNTDITKKRYSYGLNSKASIKGSSLQMIDKGFLFQKLKKKSIWVIQDTLFEILCEIYNIKMNDITKSDSHENDTLIYVVVSLNYDDKKNIQELEVSKCFSTSVSNLQDAISKKIVDVDATMNSITKTLRERINEKRYVRLKI